MSEIISITDDLDDNYHSNDLLKKLLPQHDLSDDTIIESDGMKSSTSLDSISDTTTSDGNYTLLQNDDINQDDEYSMNSQTKKQTINPLSLQYFGILVSYFCVGILDGSFIGILYPILIIDEGVSSSSYTACINLVYIFWSYKIFFGLFIDCIPLFGYRRKGYIVIGWVLCAIALCILTFLSVGTNSRHWIHLVIMLAVANLGFVMSDVAADAAMVCIAHQEVEGKRGSMQTLVNISYYTGCVIINVLILIGFSGPESNCPGYVRDESQECTTNEKISSRNELSKDYPTTWCHMQCDDATFSFGLTTSEFIYIITMICLLSLPFYLLLHEDKVSQGKNMIQFLQSFWETQLQKRAMWQILLYVMISQILFSITNAAKPTANYVYLHLSSMQNQLMLILQSLVFLIGLHLIRKRALDASWRKMVFYGTVLVTCFNLLYFLIIFDVVRSSWLYIFTDVSVEFMAALNYVASSFCTVEIVDPGFEAITLALITTASNTVNSLSAVISYQLLAFFPKLNSQESLQEDTPKTRRQFAILHALVIIINLSSLLILPMLPRQKKETQQLLQNGGTSYFWASFTLLSVVLFLSYSTFITFFTVVGADSYGCYKVLGGSGCTSHESSIPIYFLVGCTFFYCYGLIFYFVFLPLIRGRSRNRYGGNGGAKIDDLEYILLSNDDS